MLSCIPSLFSLYYLFSSPARSTPKSTSQPSRPHLPSDPNTIPYTSLRPPRCPQSCEGMCPHLPVSRHARVNGQLVQTQGGKAYGDDGAECAAGVEGGRCKGELGGGKADTKRVFEVHDVAAAPVAFVGKVDGNLRPRAGEYGVEVVARGDAGRRIADQGVGKLDEVTDASAVQTHGKPGSLPLPPLSPPPPAYGDENDTYDLSSLIDEDDREEEHLSLDAVGTQCKKEKEKNRGKGSLGHVFFF